MPQRFPIDLKPLVLHSRPRASPCELEAGCPVRSNWQRINEAVRGALEGITLAEMTSPLAPARKLVTLGGGKYAGAQLRQN